MKNARLLFALLVVAGAAACSAAEPIGPLPEGPRNSTYLGTGAGTPTDTTKTTTNPA
ncbi:MAG: hypothetical protein AB1941_21165 [Gemmatimonadota bacterium]